jgi:hypothetical protein
MMHLENIQKVKNLRNSRFVNRYLILMFIVKDRDRNLACNKFYARTGSISKGVPHCLQVSVHWRVRTLSYMP